MLSAPALELRLGRSAWQRHILTGGYVLASGAWLATGLHWLASVAGLVALAACGWRSWRAPWPSALSYRPEIGWQVSDSGRGELMAPGVRMARTGRFVTSITWAGRRGRSLALFDDAFRDSGHKRLKRLLRHGDTGAPC